MFLVAVVRKGHMYIEKQINKIYNLTVTLLDCDPINQIYRIKGAGTESSLQ